MDTYYDPGLAEEDEGPIIQEIPDALMVGDYIEIHGICRGPEVIVQLLSRHDPDVLPLQVTMASGGPVQVKSQSREKVERQEHNVRMGLQPNLDFELCIYAMEDGYEIKLNKKTVCIQKHLVKLEDVSTISMDGDADFTSVEFKDIYGDEEEEEQYHQEQTTPGLMRVQEKRESFSRHRGSPVLIRSSIRKSNRSNRDVGSTKPTWTTSNDLSRPDYDIDPARDINGKNTIQPINQVQVHSTNNPIPVEMRTSIDTPSPVSKSKFSWKPGSRKSFTFEDDKNLYQSVGGSANRIVAGDTHAGTFRTVDDGYGTSPLPGYQSGYAGSMGTLNASSGSLVDKQKRKRSSIFGKLRKSKGSETDVSVGGTEKPKKKGLKNPFKQKKSITIEPVGVVRQSYSLPDVTGRQSTTYSRLSTDIDHDQQYYVGMGADRTPVRGPVPKAVAKLAAPEIAAYVAAQKAVPEFENFHLTHKELRETAPITFAVPAESSTRSSMYGAGERKLKGTAPELADVLIDNNRAGFDQSITLTSGQQFQPGPTFVRESVYTDPSISSSRQKLKGPAPEIASTFNDQRYPQDTNLTNDKAIVGGISQPSRPTMIMAEKNIKETSGKLKGPAPEIASELYERYQRDLNHLPETTITGTLAETRQSFPVIERPIIDRDPVRSEPITIDASRQVQPVYTSRPVSVNRYERNNDDSEVSSVHSDGEYYLEVGKSDYYNERRRSLRNYRSRRSRKARDMVSGSNDSSARSSVSSLKASDKVIRPSNRKSGFDSRTQVNSWLNGYSREPEIYPSQPTRPKVYAAAPQTAQPETIELCLGKDELRLTDNAAKFPLALTPGRSAVLLGHFVDGKDENDKCLIQLRSSRSTGSGLLERMIFELWRHGKVSIMGFKNGLQYPIKDFTNVLVTNDTTSIRLEFHARGTYFAVTINEYLTSVVSDPIDPSSFDQIEMLPNSCAELDYFSVASALVIPVTIPYPTASHLQSSQSLTLNVRMDADAKCIRMEYQTQTGNRFYLILDFLNGYVYVQAQSPSDKLSLVESPRQSIPFVPEQIRQLVVLRNNNEDNLMVFANQKEIFQQSLPFPKPVGRLTEVRVSGDMLLLGARVE